MSKLQRGEEEGGEKKGKSPDWGWGVCMNLYTSLYVLYISLYITTNLYTSLPNGWGLGSSTESNKNTSPTIGSVNIHIKDDDF